MEDSSELYNAMRAKRAMEKIKLNFFGKISIFSSNSSVEHFYLYPLKAWNAKLICNISVRVTYMYTRQNKSPVYYAL